MMLYTDNSRGRNGAKDPAVVKFHEKYLLYYSIMPPLGDAGQGWDIGIAESTDLENWTKIGELGRVGKTEEKGICAPGALIYGGRVHLFYQTYGQFEKDSIAMHGLWMVYILSGMLRILLCRHRETGTIKEQLMRMLQFFKSNYFYILQPGIRKERYRCRA